MSFQNKVVLVTGASSGIGAATAIAFAAQGASVSLVGRNETKLAQIAKICEQKGSKPLVIAADVTNDADAKRIMNDTVKHYGTLDVLVNNAGIFAPTSIFSPDALEGFDRIMTTNLRSIVQLTHLAVPHLVKSKGNIVNVSSIVSLGILFDHSFAYNTSKAGMDHFTRSVALELSKHGVRVNTVNPGQVKTDITQNAGIPKEQEVVMMAAIAKSTPLQRMGAPEEIADLIMFLSSDKARGITGSTFVSDNGSLLKGLVDLK
ncbi:Short-chain dehydrogenase [Operophtera brumata]|uniref:Short-chain dehydrogenase n=1 Tax=Operophtera brumata TaxID=104452 RepID=A0A0L7LK01_OPEBR|nr:Short-chain dehydrogenase [Operophtera brumata]